MPIARLRTVALNYLQLERQIEAEHSCDQKIKSSSQTPTTKDSVTSFDRSPNLVMVHGLATNLAFWYHTAPVFTTTHRVTLFDLRGHGRSSTPKEGYTPVQMAEDLRELLDMLGIETASLVGHSFGGSVLLHFAIRYPERVSSLILADIRLKLFQPQQRPKDWPYWDKLRPTLEKVGITIENDEADIGYRLLIEMARLQLKASAEESPFPKLLSRLYPQGSSKRTAEQWLKLLDQTTAWSDFVNGESITLEQLQQLNRPTLAIYGEQSPTLPTAYALQRQWPHANFQWISEAGHFFPVSQPEKFINSVQEFLHSVDAI